MAAYEDEEEVWKCAKHPPRSSRSRRPRYGICHRCLRERLAALCPHCGGVRPCSCADSLSTPTTIKRSGSVGGRISSLFESSSSSNTEPSLRRSRSLAVAIPFLRSSNRNPADSGNTAPSFWSIFKGGGGVVAKKKVDADGDQDKENETAKKKADREEEEEEERRRRMMMRKSRSVAVTSADSGRSWRGISGGGGRGWHFPSPMKVFRQSIIATRGGGGAAAVLVQESGRSPLDRG